MTKVYDVIVVGGGHNGLVAAAYLAAAKRSVLVLERRPILEGVRHRGDRARLRGPSLPYVLHPLLGRRPSHRVMASAESNVGPDRTPEDEARATVSHGEDDPMLCHSSRRTAAAAAPSPMASIPFAIRSPWLS